MSVAGHKLVDQSAADLAVKRDERRAAGVACGAHALHVGYTDLIYVMLPIWQKEFGLGYAELGLLAAYGAGAWIRALEAAAPGTAVDGRPARWWFGALAAASALGCQLHFPGIFLPLVVAGFAAMRALCSRCAMETRVLPAFTRAPSSK